MSAGVPWQDILVGAAALAAAAWLVADRIRRRRGGKCAGCALAGAASHGPGGADGPAGLRRPPRSTPSAR